tara:strand:- start:302 stop:610 length:309 start_codon:yes stop_codon:yes gene_type:complete
MIKSMKCILFSFIATTAAAQYTGTYDSEYIRQLWNGCYQASLMTQQHPTIASVMCDCMVDQTRRTYTKQELIEMPERVKMFTRLTEICSELIKLRYGGAKPV